jgi:hypothetical protein
MLHHTSHLHEILQKYDLEDKPQYIFNLDETGLQPNHRPPNIIAAPNREPQSTTSPLSTTVTLIGCANAIGNSIPPYFVFKWKRWNPDLMRGATAGSKGVLSDSGWSNGNIFRQYLEQHFLPFVRASSTNTQPLLLLYDGHSSHVSSTLIDWAKTQNIILFVLPPHTSHLLQPLDVGIYSPFKTYYHSECSLFMKKNIGEVVNKYNMCELACKAYLKAMTPSNIQMAFKKTGIHPFSPRVISEDKLYPAEAFREDQPVKKVTAMKGGKEELQKFLLDKSEKKMPVVKEAKPETLRRPQAGGLAITEPAFHQQIQEYESSKASTANKQKRKLPLSPKPSTSGIIQRKPVAEDSCEDTSGSDDDENRALLCLPTTLSQRHKELSLPCDCQMDQVLQPLNLQQSEDTVCFYAHTVLNKI